MNIVDGACSKCGSPTYYDGTLPILCKSCRTALRAELEDLTNLFKVEKTIVEKEQLMLPGKPRQTWREYMLAK